MTSNATYPPMEIPANAKVDGATVRAASAMLDMESYGVKSGIEMSARSARCFFWYCQIAVSQMSPGRRTKDCLVFAITAPF